MLQIQLVETKSSMMRWVLGAVGTVLIGGLLYALREVLTPVFFAFLLAYLINPMVARLESWRIPRTAGIVILLAFALLAIAGFVLLVLPSIIQDIGALITELPSAAKRLLDMVTPLLQYLGIDLPTSTKGILDSVKSNITSIGGSTLSPVGSVIESMLGRTMTALNAVVAGVVIPIFAFYLLQDFHHIVIGIRELFPIHIRPMVVDIVKEVDHVLGQFIRGQLTVMAILAALYSIAYAVIGVRLALPIGVIAGLFSFIPYVGGVIALGLALAMVGLHFVGWMQVVYVIVAYSAIQILEGFIITPRIVGDKLGLAPVWVLFALMVGGELFGFLGVMLALPASAVIKVLVVRGLDSYKGSSFFRGRSDVTS